MSGSRKKKTTSKPPNNNKKETVNSPVSSAASSSADALPIGDPFERMLTTPKESLIQRASSPRRVTASPLKRNEKAEICLEQLPKIAGTNPALREKLLESKLEQCSLLCHFEPINLDGSSAYTSTEVLSSSNFGRSPICNANFVTPLELRNREIKRQALIELIELINSGNVLVPDHLYPNFFQMIFKNLFRPVPPPLNPTGDAYDPTEDEPVLEPSWPHLQLIYELFIRFLESPHLNGALARKFIDPHFILQLLGLFDVEDPRERDLLKTTLHRVYAKFLQLRSFIRKSIHNIFYEFVADPTEYRHNISEMLEILGSIINGFALPLKEEHKIFLERTLLPLHKTRYLSLYFRQLNYCIVQFVEKDPNQAVPIILGLLKIWPKTNSTKEVMFLTEIEEILDIIPIEQFRKVYKGLFKQISKCIDSNHFQVAERALMLWQNDYITNNLIPDKVEEILKILLPILSKHSKSHWNRNVQILVLNSLECFMTIDPVIFDSCVASLSELEMKSIERRKKLFYCWKSIDQNLNLNSKIINDEARDQLYLLLNDDNGVIDDEDTACINDKDYCINDKDTCINDKDDPIITTTTTTNTTNATTKITSATSTLPQVSIKKGTRRKSILPVDKNVYQELVDYSRSSSPRPDSSEDDNMEE